MTILIMDTKVNTELIFLDSTNILSLDCTVYAKGCVLFWLSSLMGEEWVKSQSQKLFRVSPQN